MPPPPSPPVSPAPKPTNFAFPFRSADKKLIVDEHVLHGWLADETTGNFAFTQSGMWHGGIHVSADGAGKHLDLAHGVRCIADGHVIAYWIHRDYLTSEIAAAEGETAQTVHYSAAFTLVRHTLEYPADNRLTFFSLYMHLRSLEDYRKQGVSVPAYWPKAHEVSQYANNRPLPDPHQGAAPPEQVGQNIRSQPNLAGTVLGILQRGARVRIGARSPNGKWGRIETIESGTVLPPKVATLPGPGAETGWVYLAKEQGHWPLTEVISEDLCDQIVTPAPIPIKAGDLVGHLGEYWQPENPTQPHQQVHIEVFCDGTLPAFLARSREAALNITDFGKLPLLRIDRGVKLYGDPSIHGEGKDAPQTAVVQIYSQAALDAFPEDHKRPADNLNWGGQGEPWWKITSANSRYDDITGWVRNRQTPAGRVTRESQHAWPDFDVFETDSGDGLPTLFDSTEAWLDHALRADKPDIHHACKLNPLTCELYRGLSPVRNESNAANDLRAHGENRWTRFRASRLIPKHRSEWANQAQYEDFFETVLKRIDREPYHDAELARIKRMTWWDAVANNVSQPFPASPDVFHIHPLALVGSFLLPRRPISDLIQKIGDIISSGEGNYESYNSGTKNVPNGAVGHSFMSPPPGTVTNKTINQIIATDSLSGTNPNRFFATGKYQTIINTLRSAKESMGLTGDEKYDAAMQERVFRDYLLDKAGGGILSKFVKKGEGTINDAQYAASKEWASIAVPAGMPIKNGQVSNGTLSYYSSSANSAFMGPTNKLREILELISSGSI
ncbi:SH3 domain-containing protein [Ralstonia sp. A12]|uniref:SH3 domain-containing protein n=1 Tax=Ralstonia sp. A12 TaxID=1217052 RepID=UPI000693AE1F|nr:SH3 domain-containing protein [Ralstonia sp. A12]